MALNRVCIDNSNDTSEKSIEFCALDVCRDISNRTVINVPHEFDFLTTANYSGHMKNHPK